MPVISASTSPVNPVVIKLPQPIITILIKVIKIITHVNGFGFSFKKITEKDIEIKIKNRIFFSIIKYFFI